MLQSEQLEAGLGQIEGLAHDETALFALLRYAELLQKWGRVYNLTSLLSDEDILTHHLLDSAAFVPYVARLMPQAKTLLDVGSGGGLPVIPLAIYRRDLRLQAVDAVAKKVAFLTQVGIELKLSHFSARHCRVEKLRGGYDVITSRAFASLGDFISWTQHLLNPGGCWLAMKGAYPTDEIAELPEGVSVKDVFEVKVPLLNEQRHVVMLQKTA